MQLSVSVSVQMWLCSVGGACVFLGGYMCVIERYIKRERFPFSVNYEFVIHFQYKYNYSYSIRLFDYIEHPITHREHG